MRSSQEVTMRRYYFTPQELTIMALAVESASEELLAAQMAEDENVAGARRRIEGYTRTIAEHEAVLSKIRRYWDDETYETRAGVENNIDFEVYRGRYLVLSMGQDGEEGLLTTVCTREGNIRSDGRYDLFPVIDVCPDCNHIALFNGLDGSLDCLGYCAHRSGVGRWAITRRWAQGEPA
jgi:hypothetical protein